MQKKPEADRLSAIGLEEVSALAASAFMRAGVAEDHARLSAETLVLAEAMGIATHGLTRVRDYIGRISAGGIDPAAVIVAEELAPALRLVDGHDGLGPAVARSALAAAADAARAAGVGAAFVTNGNHLGALAPYLYIAAEQGLASLLTTNAAPMMAPPGGRVPLLGNNPFGIGVPHPEGRHVLLDMALSVVSRSRVRRALSAGERIPEHWATDGAGRPTADPREAMAGLMQAIGGGKGAALALSLDLLAGVMSGAGFLSGISTAAERPDCPQTLGQMFILIDVARLLPEDARRDRLEEAARIVTGSPPVDEEYPVRMPGARALHALACARADGLTLPDNLLSDLRALA